MQLQRNISINALENSFLTYEYMRPLLICPSVCMVNIWMSVCPIWQLSHLWALVNFKIDNIDAWDVRVLIQRQKTIYIELVCTDHAFLTHCLEKKAEWWMMYARRLAAALWWCGFIKKLAIVSVEVEEPNNLYFFLVFTHFLLHTIKN